MYKRVKTQFLCYSGYSTDKNIRYHSSSGGVVTQTLLFLLKEKIINGVLVSRIKENTQTETIIAKTEKEILSCQGSVYQPVPFLSGLESLSRETGLFAVVGLPCHFRILEQKRFDHLRKKIFLKIGLFCKNMPTQKATEDFLNSVDIQKREVNYLKYRGLGRIGWTIAKTNNKEIKKSFRESWNFLTSKPEYYCKGIDKCNDTFAHLSDMACGDAWLPEYSEDSLGTSLVISYSSRAKDILQLLVKTKKLFLEEISFNKILQSQGYEIVNTND